jgi:DNA processing protein
MGDVSSAVLPGRPSRGVTRRLQCGDPEYPRRLLDLPSPPRALTISGKMDEERTIAIVGTRTPSPDAEAFARHLAGLVVSKGGIVASGGALGIDAAAHEAALDAGGVTWVVAATGKNELFPPKNAELFARVRVGRGVMIWPFEDSGKASPPSFFARNGVLAALAHALVIVQAGAPSGTLNAASWARRLGRPVWAVCAPPWMPEYMGCASAVERGARPLVSVSSFLKAVGLAPSRRTRNEPSVPSLVTVTVTATATATPTSTATSTATSTPTSNPTTLGPSELGLLDLLSVKNGQHIDEIAAKSGLSAPVVATLLLTLALENVVVESPEGFFSRQSLR